MNQFGGPSVGGRQTLARKKVESWTEPSRRVRVMLANASIQDATRLRRFSARRRFRWAFNLRRRVESPRLDTRFRGYDRRLHSYSGIRRDIERLFLASLVGSRGDLRIPPFRESCRSEACHELPLFGSAFGVERLHPEPSGVTADIPSGRRSG